MFYLYIDGLLVSSSAEFNEIISAVFNYLNNIVTITRLNVVLIVKEILNLLFGSLHGLIKYQYDCFELYNMKVEIYYGDKE